MKRLSHEHRLPVADKTRLSQRSKMPFTIDRQSGPLPSPPFLFQRITDPGRDMAGKEKVSQSLTQERKEENELKEKPT